MNIFYQCTRELPPRGEVVSCLWVPPLFYVLLCVCIMSQMRECLLGENWLNRKKTLRSAKTWRLGWSERTGKQVLGTEVEIRKCSVQGSLCSDQLKVITLQFYSILTFFIFNMLFLMDSFNQFVLILKLPLEKFSVWVLCSMHRDVCAVAVFYGIS